MVNKIRISSVPFCSYQTGSLVTGDAISLVFPKNQEGLCLHQRSGLHISRGSKKASCMALAIGTRCSGILKERPKDVLPTPTNSQSPPGSSRDKTAARIRCFRRWAITNPVTMSRASKFPAKQPSSQLNLMLPSLHFPYSVLVVRTDRRQKRRSGIDRRASSRSHKTLRSTRIELRTVRTVGLRTP